MRKFALAVLAVLALSTTARAALVLRVPDIVLTQSASVQTGSFSVYLEETSPTDDFQVHAYNVGVRLSSTGVVSFTGAGMSLSPHPALFTGQTPDVPPTQPTGYVAGRDIFVGDSFPQSGTPQNASVINGVQDGLFRVNYSVPANAIGSVAINVDSNPLLFLLSDRDANDVPVTIDNGSFTVTAIPEPAAMGLALLALPLLARRRR